MSTPSSSAAWQYDSAEALHTGNYLTGPVLQFCSQLGVRTVLDAGCGNGALCGVLVRAGYTVTGFDVSTDGITQARKAHPGVAFHVLTTEDDPAVLGGPFDAVVSTEVIEHLYSPLNLATVANKVLPMGGHFILSTPYHGYLKNLLLALTGKLDAHFTANWEGGHIKFFSRKSLTHLLADAGFAVTHFHGAGRFPYLWKSMILVAKKVREV